MLLWLYSPLVTYSVYKVHGTVKCRMHVPDDTCSFFYYLVAWRRVHVKTSQGFYKTPCPRGPLWRSFSTLNTENNGLHHESNWFRCKCHYKSFGSNKANYGLVKHRGRTLTLRMYISRFHESESIIKVNLQFRVIWGTRMSWLCPIGPLYPKSTLIALNI